MTRLGLSGKECSLLVLYMEQDQGDFEGGVSRPLGAQQIALLVSVPQLQAVFQAELPRRLWEHLSSDKMWLQTGGTLIIAGSKATSHLSLRY